MASTLWIVHILLALVLIGLVLLQPGQAGGMGTALGGSSQTLFGSQGSTGVLGRITSVLAAIFFCTSLGLAYLSTGEEEASVMEQEPPKKQEPKEPGVPTIPESGADLPTPPKASPQGKGKRE